MSFEANAFSQWEGTDHPGGGEGVYTEGEEAIWCLKHLLYCEQVRLSA